MGVCPWPPAGSFGGTRCYQPGFGTVYGSVSQPGLCSWGRGEGDSPLIGPVEGGSGSDSWQSLGGRPPGYAT